MNKNMKLPPISSNTLKSGTLNSEKMKENKPHDPLSPSLKIDKRVDSS